jgi:branched-chain amino acid aminotransferase
MTDFADRDGWIWLDGALVPWREANLHVLSHALHYASSVFEGQRAYGGEVFKLRAHSARLKQSAELLGFDIPWSLDAIDAASRDVLAANHVSEAYLRPIAWRGSEETSVSATRTKIHLAVAAWQWGAYFGEEAIRRGTRMTLAEWRLPPPVCAPAAAMASGLYMIATLAKNAAEAKGYGDALMLDWRGQVAESTGANIFLVMGDELHTPTPDCFLNGITRQTVIGLAKARQIKVVERAIMPEEFARTQEVFLTGSAAEITPVAEIDKYKFTPAGPMTRALMADFDKATAALAR